MDSYLVHRNKKPLIYYYTLKVTYLFNELPYTKNIYIYIYTHKKHYSIKAVGDGYLLRDKNSGNF